MVNVASIFSTLGNPNSLIPLAIKDTASTTGMTIGSYITGKEEGHDRFIDEVGTEAIWLGGIPFYKWLFDSTVFRAVGLDSKFDARNLKDKALLEKIKEYAPTDEIKNSIEKAINNKNKFKHTATAKFIVSTALTVEDVRLFAKLTDTELVVIDENTDLNKLQSELQMLDLLAKLK